MWMPASIARKIRGACSFQGFKHVECDLFCIHGAFEPSVSEAFAQVLQKFTDRTLFWAFPMVVVGTHSAFLLVVV